MRMNQFLSQSLLLLGVGLLVCDNDKEQKQQNSNLSQKELLYRLENYSHFGAPSDINSYKIMSDGQYAIARLDSADIHAEIYIDLPSAYDFILSRKSSKDSAHYHLRSLKLVNDQECSSSTKFNAYSIDMSYDNANVPVRANNTPTNLKELELYGVYDPIFSARTGQCKVGSDEYTPSGFELISPLGSVTNTHDVALETIALQKEIAKQTGHLNAQIVEITRKEGKLSDPLTTTDGKDVKTTRYIITMN